MAILIFSSLILSGLLSAPFGSSKGFVLSGSKIPIEGVEDDSLNTAATENKDSIQLGFIPFVTVVPTPTLVPVPTFVVPPLAETPTPTIPFFGGLTPTPTPPDPSTLPECATNTPFYSPNPGCACNYGAPYVCWEDTTTADGFACSYTVDRTFSSIPAWLTEPFDHFQCIF